MHNLSTTKIKSIIKKDNLTFAKDLKSGQIILIEYFQDIQGWRKHDHRDRVLFVSDVNPAHTPRDVIVSYDGNPFGIRKTNIVRIVGDINVQIKKMVFL